MLSVSRLFFAMIGVLAIGAWILDAREVSSYGWAWSGYAALLTGAFVVAAMQVIWKQDRRIRQLEHPSPVSIGPLAAMMATGRAIKDQKINPSNPKFASDAKEWERKTYILLMARDLHLAQSFMLGDPQQDERTPDVRAMDNWARFMDVRLQRLDEIIAELRAR